MLRRCCLIGSLFLVSLASAANGAWPDRIGSAKLTSNAAYHPASTPAIWEEFGLEKAEKADYGSFQVIAYRFKDTTGSFAAGKWLRATDASSITEGNYLITCAGRCPGAAGLAREVVAHAPQVSHANYPSLEGHLPVKRVARSERYILGPASLAEFAPGIPGAAAAFQFGTEAELARYKAPGGGEAMLTVFSFPTPQMARQQAPEFEKIPGAKAKRTGPLVAVVLQAGGNPIADGLLAQVNYVASVAWDQPVPKPFHAQSLGQMLYSIVLLAGLLLVFCALAGVAFGLFRVVARRLGYRVADEGMITLHLQDR